MTNTTPYYDAHPLTDTRDGYCGCGCGETCDREFNRGHDVKLKSKFKKAWRETNDKCALEALREKGWLDRVKDLRTYGIEIECLIPGVISREALASIIQAAGVDCTAERYNHQTREHWKVITDSSLRATPGYHGVEVVSPVLRGRGDRRQIEAVCKALQDAGAIVNKSCGLHIHHGTHDLTVDMTKRLIRLLEKHESTIDSLLAPSRRGRNNDSYCRSLSRNIWMTSLESCTTVEEICDRVFDRCRYTSLNLMAYVRQGTIEFRQHQGTTNAEKILNWLDFGKAALRYARNSTLPTTQPPTDALFDCLELSNDDITFWNERREQLAA